MEPSYRLAIFDPSVLVRSKKPERTSPAALNDWIMIPQAARTVQSMLERGIMVGIAANQSGAAFGYVTQTQIRDELEKVAQACGIPANLVQVNFDHDRGTKQEFRRVTSDHKPAPGMIFALMHQTGVEPGETVMIGGPEDQETAKCAGCAYLGASAFWQEAA